MNQEGIRLIEETPLLSLISKINVLLVYVQEKPSTFCSRQVDLYNAETDTISVDEVYVSAVREFFEELAIPRITPPSGANGLS